MRRKAGLLTVACVTFMGGMLCGALVSAPDTEAKRVPCSPVGSLAIETLEKEVFVNGDLVVAHGRWQSATRTNLTTIPIVNTVDIMCSHPQKTCKESIAMLYSGLDEDVRGEGYGNVLMVSTHEYEIVEWSRTVVVAVERPRAADIELRVSLEHKTAERTVRETGARGATGASPVPKRWVLQ